MPCTRVIFIFRGGAHWNLLHCRDVTRALQFERARRKIPWGRGAGRNSRKTVEGFSRWGKEMVEAPTEMSKAYWEPLKRCTCNCDHYINTSTDGTKAHAHIRFAMWHISQRHAHPQQRWGPCGKGEGLGTGDGC